MNTFNTSIAEGKFFWAWGPLIFTSFYFLPTITGWYQLSTIDVIYVASLYALFVLVYRQAIHSKGDSVIPWLIAMATVLLLGTYFTSGTQALFGYVAFIAGFNLSIKKSSFVVIILLLVIFLSGYLFTNNDVHFYVPAILISIGLFSFGAFTQRDVVHQIKEMQSEQQIEQLATIAERERIARDLHDVIGHHLSSIALKAELAGKYIHLKDDKNACKEIEAVASMSREMLTEVRHAVSDLKLQNLKSKFEKLMSELTNQGLHVDPHYEINSLPANVESTLALILTESVTNIMRHSNATTVKVHLFTKDKKVYLHITDNGTYSSYAKGNGLIGIEERCLQLHGKLTINTDNGFSLSVVLPNER